MNPVPPPAPPPAVMANEDVDMRPPDDIPPAPTLWGSIQSALNRFGLYRDYPSNPSYHPYNPSSVINTESIPLSDSPLNLGALPPSLRDEEPTNPYFPFSNSTLFGLLRWKWSGSNSKSDLEFGKLLDFLRSPEFSQVDAADINLDSEIRRVDKFIDGTTSSTLASDSESGAQRGVWKEVSVPISIPDGQPHPSVQASPTFQVPGLHYRSLVEVIKDMISNPDLATYFHYTPYRQYFEPPGIPPEISTPVDDAVPNLPPMRVYDELYSSDAMINAHIELQNLPPEENCSLERVVAAVMLYSDSTHLASFGTASAWPVYMSFGNQSKYVRCKPRAGACQHVAYIPKVSLL